MRSQPARSQWLHWLITVGLIYIKLHWLERALNGYKPGDLNLIPTHTKMEEKQLHKAVCWLPPVNCGIYSHSIMPLHLFLPPFPPAPNNKFTLKKFGLYSSSCFTKQFNAHFIWEPQQPDSETLPLNRLSLGTQLGSNQITTESTSPLMVLPMLYLKYKNVSLFYSLF